MRNSVYLLVTVMVIAGILAAGWWLVVNQTSPGPSQVVSTNASTSSTTTALTSSTATASPTASPTVAPSPSASPSLTTPTPSIPAGKIATSIQFDSDPGSVKQGTPVSLGIEVIAPTSSQLMVCGHGAVTVSIGTVTPGSSSDCFKTAFFSLDTSGLKPGTYEVILRYAGDSTYQPSQSSSKITVTA